MFLRRRLMVDRRNPNTIALFHFDEAFSASNYVDDYGNAWTLSGNAPNISLTQKKFGNSSLYLNNTAKLSLDTGVAFQDFTMECFVYPTSRSNSYNWRNVCGLLGAGTDGKLYISMGSSSEAAKYMYTKPASSDLGLRTTKNSWNHIAITCDFLNSKVDVFLNGTRVYNNQTITWNNRPDTMQLYIGHGASCVAYIDDFRFSKGRLYNSSTYTVPTEPLD